MGKQRQASSSPGPRPPRGLTLLLLVLFVGSGCAALIYEIVWLQLLQLVIGSSAVSLGVLLGTFMGGMCLGSLLLPRLVTAGRHPLRVYGILELGIGLIGVAVLLAMPHVDRLYAAVGAQGAAGLWLRVAVCTACLLPPTALMGATLPAVARWVESTPAGAARLGLFYGGNIAGAVLGCLLAGFYLLRVHDVAVATYVAAGINGVVGLIGLALAARVPHAGAGTPGPAGATGASAPALPSPPPSPRLVYLVIGLSGLCALAAEVVWTRVLSLLLGATVYTFSIILAVFLTGLGIGTAVGSALARRVANPRRALGWCQALAVAAVAWSAYAVARSLPYWPIEGEATENVWFGFGRDLLRCAWALLPPTVMWGASFPLALAAATARGRDPGRVAGGVYAANTVGAIVGAVAASVWLIPTIGTRNVQRGVILLAAVAAALAFAARGGPAPAARSNPPAARRRPAPATAALLLAALTAAAAALAWRVPKIPDLLIAYGRSTLTAPEVGPDSAMARDLRFLFVGEGVSSSVAVTDWHGLRHFHVSGKVEASSQWQDMRVQRMLGHLPALVHPRPASVLVVGCGAGVTAGSFVVHPEVERIVICEIEPLIPRVVARHFAEENHGVLSDPRLTIVYDDARHYVLTTRERFDVITSDPIHPWVKGAASLYTREYFEMCRARLNPGGVFVQWVPLYESTPDAVKSELATFFEVFPHGTVWANDLDGEGYDVVLLGQDAPSVIDLDEIQLRRVGRRDRARVAASLQQVGFGSAAALFATYAGRGPDLREWLAGAAINRDRNLRLQYIAGMGRGQQRGSQIYHQMLAHRRFPRDLFAESELYGEALRQWMGEAGAE